MAQLVAMAGDPHTSLYPSGPVFALTFRSLDDGIFVTGAAAQYAQALGARLVAVGGTDIGTVLSALATVVPHTNPQWVAYEAQSRLRYQQLLQGLDLVPATASTAFTFQDAAGQQFTLQVTPSNDAVIAAPSSSGPLPEFAQNSGLNYWFTYFAAQRLLYFKYNVCEDDPADPFAAFAARLFSVFDANPVDTLVIDFRGNTGGDSSVINPFLAGIQSRALALAANPAFLTYDVIDGGMFSSGLDDAMEIKSTAIAAASQYPGLNLDKSLVVIGSPSGGPPAGYGEVLPFALPYLGMSGQYSTAYFSLPPFIPAGEAFSPDVAVSNRSSDYFARHDPALAAIFARSPAAPAAPSGGTIVVNGASFRNDQGVAPGAFAAAFGAFPKILDGVAINGITAQILSATTSQINLIVPVNLIPGQAVISVRSGGAEVSNGAFTVIPAGLGLFVLPGDSSEPGAVLNQDSSVNGAASPASQNSVVQIYGTGFAQSAQVLFGDTPAQALYNGPVAGVPGLWQINATVPAGMTGQIPVYAITGNTVSNAVTVWVK
jgi:uncharacterized protein (TIGR03437 family)